MKVIWKYSLEVADIQVVMMPKDAKILCVRVQRNVPCIWAECHIDNEKESRTIAIRNTGHNFEYVRSDYIDTFQLNNGELVFHVYEIFP